MKIEQPAVWRHNEALDSVREEALALPRNEVRRINVDVWDATIVAFGTVARIAPLRGEMARDCGGLDLERVDRLERYARALGQATTAYAVASRPPPRVQELTARLKAIRGTLISDIRAAGKRRLVQAEPLKNLSGKAGALNTSTDVLALCAFVQRNWAALDGASGITLAELYETEALAEEAHRALSHKPHEGKDLAKLADLRRRVFTLFFNAYDETRRAVTYLRWRQGDAEKIAPSLLRDRGRRRAEEAAEVAAAAQGASPLPWD